MYLFSAQIMGDGVFCGSLIFMIHIRMRRKGVITGCSAFRHFNGQTRRCWENKPFVMRRKVAYVATEWNKTMGWEMKWSKTGCCVRNICEWIQPEQQNGMKGLIVERN